MDWSSPHSEILAALLGADSGLEIIDVAGLGAVPSPGRMSVVVDAAGKLPAIDASAFDLAITTADDAQAPWVSVSRSALEHVLAGLAARVQQFPVASSIARFVFRMSPSLAFDDALALESLAYSALLVSSEFKAWRARNPAPAKRGRETRVDLRDNGDGWIVELDRPHARNAFDARMRDALVDALEAVGADPRGGCIELRGAGAAFSAGGDLAEFGEAADPGLAHLIRVRQSPTRLIYAMRDRVVAHVHGACIGAGVEVPAAAGRVVAAADTQIRLPEIGMGLIPGAGGSASIPRRIGRSRALYLALSGETINAAKALEWGLVDAIEGKDL